MRERSQLKRRFEPRLKTRLVGGLLVGALVGGVLGLVVGLLAFDGRAPAIVACALGGAIAGLLYGGLVGSFAGLESPHPGSEPSDSADPLSEPAIETEAQAGEGADPPPPTDPEG
jgi:hypothetical protein